MWSTKMCSHRKLGGRFLPQPFLWSSFSRSCSSLIHPQHSSQEIHWKLFEHELDPVTHRCQNPPLACMAPWPGSKAPPVCFAWRLWPPLVLSPPLVFTTQPHWISSRSPNAQTLPSSKPLYALPWGLQWPLCSPGFPLLLKTSADMWHPQVAPLEWLILSMTLPSPSPS